MQANAKPNHDIQARPTSGAEITSTTDPGNPSLAAYTRRKNQLKGLRPAYVRACQFLGAPALLYYGIVQISEDNLPAAAACLVIGLLATQAHRIGLSAQEARLAREMSGTDDILAVGPLAEVLDWPDRSLREAASTALCRLLPRLTPNDKALLNEGQWECLYRMLRPDVAAREPELIHAILVGVTQAGDSTGIPHVRRLAEMPSKTDQASELKTLAAHCLQSLVGRSSNETLLRPAGLNRATADVLLRPAGGESISRPDVLLRAHGGEEQPAGPPASPTGIAE